MEMSAKSTENRHLRRAGQQGARPSVLSQAEVEKYATGCGNLSLPSEHHCRQIKTQINQKKKNCKIKTIVGSNRFSIGTINVRTAKEELKLSE